MNSYQTFVGKKFGIFSSFLLYIVLMVPLFFSAVHTHHMYSSPMQDCPFVNEQPIICSTGIEKNTKITTPIFLKIVPVISLGFIFVIFILAPSVARFFLYLKSQKYRKLFRLYPLLFSQGILNTKEYRRVYC